MNYGNYRPQGYNNIREFLMYCRRGAANKWVRNAKRAGLIPPANKLKCVDCGKRASQYDHRDYDKPDCVDAVCVFCHGQRGPGSPHDISTSKLKRLYAKELEAKFMKDERRSRQRILQLVKS